MFVVKFRHDTFFRQTLDKILNPIVFDIGLSNI